MAGLFSKSAITAAGLALLAKAQTDGFAVPFTRIETGNGTYDGTEDLPQATALKSAVQTSNLKALTRDGAVTTATAVFKNTQPPALVEGYYITEVGLYATDPDDGEILFAIGLGVKNKYDFMPDASSLVATVTINFAVAISSDLEVTMETPDRTYLYDDTTGDKYVLGVDNGLIYFEEDES